jgi:hypothetical protein
MQISLVEKPTSTKTESNTSPMHASAADHISQHTSAINQGNTVSLTVAHCVPLLGLNGHTSTPIDQSGMKVQGSRKCSCSSSTIGHSQT